MPPRLFLAEDDFAEGTLQVTATSSNPALLPSSALTLNGASPYFTLAATPTMDQIGTTTVNVTASDGTQTSSQNFTLNVVGTPLQTWRQQYFNSMTNRGNAADNSDANADGESNFMEFATAQNPHTNNRATPILVRNGANLEFTYLRSDAALAENVVFIVEWSDYLTAGSWSTTGVNQTILSDNGTTQSVRGSIPASASSKRFLRLRVVE